MIWTWKEISLSSMKIKVPFAQNSFIEFSADVADANIALLIGLDVLDIFSLIVNTYKNVLERPPRNVKIPLHRKLGHVYLQWGEKSVLFTKSELLKMHKAFYHPSNDKPTQRSKTRKTKIFRRS